MSMSLASALTLSMNEKLLREIETLKRERDQARKIRDTLLEIGRASLIVIDASKDTYVSSDMQKAIGLLEEAVTKWRGKC
jgi:hypothetical protein